MAQGSSRKTYSLVALAALVLAPATYAETRPRTVPQELATISVESGTIAFRPSTGDGLTLEVVGDTYRWEQRFARGQAPSFVPVDRDGFTLPDGLYKWELVANPELPAAPSVGYGKPAHGRETHQVAASAGRRQLGAFSIRGGRLVDSSLVESRAPSAPGAQLPKAARPKPAAAYDDSDAAAPHGRPDTSQ